jgi:dolichol-phosphate mannosyltransferase
MRPNFSIIIPTYNEEDSIQDTIQKISHTLRLTSIPFEIIVVDDNSKDKTESIVTDLILRKYPVSLVTRTKDPGLSQAVIEGFKRAQGEVVAVTDADGSHDISLLPQMYREIKNNNIDIVIGSRYMKGGATKDWPIKRKIISFGATFLGRILFPEITDPVSGFFAVKTDLVIHTPSIQPCGYKILLEILGKCRWHNIKEIPYVFQNRKSGESKMKIKQIVEYVQQIMSIAIFPGRAWDEVRRMINFAIVGLVGVGVNMTLLAIFKEWFSIPLIFASFLAIEMSIISNYILNDTWTFKEINNNTWIHRMISYNAISLGSMVINVVVLIMLSSVGINYLIANGIGIIIGFIWNFIMNRKITWVNNSPMF